MRFAPGFMPNFFPDFDLNLPVQSPNQWCSCDKNQHWVSQQSVVSIILYFTMQHYLASFKIQRSYLNRKLVTLVKLKYYILCHHNLCVPTVGFAPTSSLSGRKRQLYVLWEGSVLLSHAGFPVPAATSHAFRQSSIYSPVSASFKVSSDHDCIFVNTPSHHSSSSNSAMLRYTFIQVKGFHQQI